MEEREGDGASSIPARRRRGKGWIRVKEVRGGFKWGWKGERAAGGEGIGAGGPAAINGAGEICGSKYDRLNAREREKWGERERGSRGVFPPTLLHAGTTGGGGSGGGARRGRGGGSGGRKEMTGGPHPSARVAGGPARQRRARPERPSGPRGEEREGEGDGPNSAH